MATRSAEPARIWSARVKPKRTTSRRLPPRARSQASTTHGIRDAPAK